MTTGDHATGDRSRRRHQGRAGALGLLLAAALAGAAALSARAGVREWDRLDAAPISVDDAIPLAALVVMLIGLTWLAVVAAACAVELLRSAATTHRRDEALVHRLSPGMASRVTGLLLAVTAFGGLGDASTATASTPAASTPGATLSASAVAADPGVDRSPGIPLPDFAPPREAGSAPHSAPGTTPDSAPDTAPDTAPDAAPDAAKATAPCADAPIPDPGWTGSGPALQRRAATDQTGLLGRCRPATTAGDIVVHRGDSLWSIVERDLGADATPAQIAAEWPRWFAANRAVIGADPDLLLPGMTLHRPTLSEVSR